MKAMLKMLSCGRHLPRGHVLTYVFGTAACRYTVRFMYANTYGTTLDLQCVYEIIWFSFRLPIPPSYFSFFGIHSQRLKGDTLRNYQLTESWLDRVSDCYWIDNCWRRVGLSWSDGWATMTKDKIRSHTSAVTWIVRSVIVLLSVLLFLIVVLVRSSASGNVSSTTTPPVRTTLNHPIILVGLPHSGSLAIHEYLKCHGLSSIHYCCDGSSKTEFPCESCGDCVLKNLQARRPAFKRCLGSTTMPQVVWSRFDQETAETWFLPQHFAIGLLHESYPHATWILQTRGSSKEWATSIYHWHSMTRRIFHAFGLPIDPPHALTPAPDPKSTVSKEEIEADMEWQLQTRVYNQTEHRRKLELLELVYDNHTATIYQWATQFDTHRLVQINVDDPKASIQRLHEALGLKSVVSSNGKGRCEWTFRSPTDDWNDFSFPFLP